MAETPQEAAGSNLDARLNELSTLIAQLGQTNLGASRFIANASDTLGESLPDDIETLADIVVGLVEWGLLMQGSVEQIQTSLTAIRSAMVSVQTLVGADAALQAFGPWIQALNEASK